jgi:hypothetical protein
MGWEVPQRRRNDFAFDSGKAIMAIGRLTALYPGPIGERRLA